MFVVRFAISSSLFKFRVKQQAGMRPCAILRPIPDRPHNTHFHTLSIGGPLSCPERSSPQLRVHLAIMGVGRGGIVLGFDGVRIFALAYKTLA